MAVHVFLTDKENYEICTKHGLVGAPEGTYDGLLSRMACIHEGDYILMYITKKQELHGVWQAEGLPFYDENPVWPGEIYPYRCKIKCSEYNFSQPLRLDDINDLRNSGMIWTWALKGPRGTNAVFSLTMDEFYVLLNEFVKINPFSMTNSFVPVPYAYHQSNLMEYVHFQNGLPLYEGSLMVLLNTAFTNKQFKDIFGNYTDYLSYVPTNLGKEMDVLLMYENPMNHNITSYDIIEVKRDKFDEKALTQLIGYESWFLHKKVSGDMKMVRTTAIAKSFSPSVVEYVKQRKVFENKPIKLLTYSCPGGEFRLNPVE